MLQQAGDEDLDADEDQNGAAEDAGLACQLGAGLFADVQAHKADEEGDHADEQRGQQASTKL